MTPDSVGPLSRPVGVERLPEGGMEVVVEADEEERVALARDFKLPAIRSLVGTFRVSGSPERVRVTGRVAAEITQTCVVTLEPFDTRLDEEVEVDFSSQVPESTDEVEVSGDEPDPLVSGRVDLGALTAEFLALGLDPYPRKPGVAFDAAAVSDEDGASPFAALRKLTREG